MRIELDDLARATSALVVGGHSATDPATDAGGVAIDGASQDSREIRTGSLFVAVRAERDGHDFVGAAADRGAAAALVEHRVDADVPQLVVGSVPEALRSAATLARSLIAGPVVGITGSVGKTTTKDLLASVLGRLGVVGASERSFNNELGVPLTLLRVPGDAWAAVVEMGAREPGHVADLCTFVRPDIAVVTTVAAAHLETFGSVAAIAAAKGELVESIGPSGTAVLNADVPLVAAMARRAAGSVVTFGQAGDVRAEGVVLDDQMRPVFRLASDWGRCEVRVAVAGMHNVSNALAAAATGLALGVDLSDVAAGLDTAVASRWRMEVRRRADGAIVINDAYNANPTSTRAALASLAQLPVSRRVAVLGKMAELGPAASEAHRGIAEYAAQLGIELIAVDTDLYGVDPAADPLSATQIGPDVAVLVKASRSVGLEWLADRLLAGSGS